jgi:hypothetical protein
MHVMIALVAAVWAAHTIYRLIPVPAAVDRASLARVIVLPYSICVIRENHDAVKQA